jgi:uracil-DNA glycosylase family protein
MGSRKRPPKQTTSSSRKETNLRSLRAAAHDCHACDLWQSATQTVFGEGPARAAVMLVGEQPGDQEDKSGRPFVGPAGRVLERALAEAGIARENVYLTNVVKHFKFQQRGKRRMHQRANADEQAACRQWLDAELARVKPQVIVCLGAMAAHSLLGASFRLLEQRGQWQEIAPGVRAFATVHPSYLLRLRDEKREPAYRQFVRDLRLTADLTGTGLPRS